MSNSSHLQLEIPVQPMENETPSYQNLFVLGAEIPRFAISYRWWEDEATTVLWAFNIPEISQVIRYRLFRDDNAPRNSLISRNADTIEAFLVSLCEPRDQQLLSTLSHLQRVEEILRRSSIPPFRPIPWSWFPPLPDHSLDARSIAAAIETESHFQFGKIEFEELVRASLGYNAPSIEWFLLQHTALYIHLKDHLQAFPEEISLYVEVEKHLRSRSPFARRAILQCLQDLVPEVAGNIPFSKKPGFEFIAQPIQTLFSRPNSLTTVLKVFSVLGVRFRRHYIHTSKMDWYTPFDTTILFLEEYLGSTSATDLARTLTGTDEYDFASLSRQGIMTGDATVKSLLSSWQTLSISVWETQDLLPKRNYHSLTAILNGLHMYAIATAPSRGLNSTIGGMVVLDPLLPPETIFLTNPSHNYATYRQYYRENPGLPFLFPHLREYQQQGEPAIQPLLDYLQNPLAFSRGEW
ncbi:hypothetical protein N7528_007398 [Penicillium herquei]|nr:hypothetical protein N7528_007398 [Penicillium herquei]